MKQADIILSLNKGHEVPLHGVTPAEVLLLVAEHHTNAGGDPIVSLTESKTEVTRSPDEEVSRLRQKYHAKKIAALFPGAIPQLPDSFAKARELGVRTALPTTKLTETKLA